MGTRKRKIVRKVEKVPNSNWDSQGALEEDERREKAGKETGRPMPNSYKGDDDPEKGRDKLIDLGL
jgi:hypothetical protein